MDFTRSGFSWKKALKSVWIGAGGFEVFHLAACECNARTRLGEYFRDGFSGACHDRDFSFKADRCAPSLFLFLHPRIGAGRWALMRAQKTRTRIAVSVFMPNGFGLFRKPK